MRNTLIFMAGLLAALMLFLVMPILREGANRLRQRFYSWQLRLLANTLGAQMVAATAIVSNDRPAGHTFTGSFTLDPGSIAAGGRELETAVIPGVAAGDVIVVTPRVASAVIVGHARVASAGNIEFALENNTIGAVDLASGVWDFAAIRGSTMALR